jgi:hypothetical protein
MDKSATNYLAAWALAKQSLRQTSTEEPQLLLFADPATHIGLSERFKLLPEKTAFLPVVTSYSPELPNKPELGKYLLFWGDPANPDNLCVAVISFQSSIPAFPSDWWKRTSAWFCVGESP